MTRKLALLRGLALGAGLMYLIDPDQGRRRRALVRDRARHLGKEAGEAIVRNSRHLGSRARGTLAGVRSLFRHEDVSDEVLVARVRSKMGHLVSHPGLIQVAADRGHVALGGPVLAGEKENLLWSVAAVRGVTAVEDRLESLARPEELLGLGAEPSPNSQLAGPDRDAGRSPG